MKFRAWGLLLAFLSLTLVVSCRATTPPRGGSGPSAGDGFIYLASREGKVLALSLEHRSQRLIFPAFGEWSYPEGNGLGAIYGNPTLAGGKLYVGALNGVLYSLDLASGRELWSKLLDGAIVASPSVQEGRVFVAAGRNVYAVDGETGKYLWPEHFTAEAKIWASPLVAGGKVYVASMDHWLYALEASTGRVLWKFATGGAIVAPPWLEGSRLFVGSFDRGLYAIEANQGRALWPQPYRVGGWLWARPIYWEGTIIVGALDNKVYAINAGSGQLVWDRDFSSNPSTAAMVGGVLVLGLRDGLVVGLDPSTGQKRWDFKARSPVLFELAVKDGIIYVATEAGDVFAIDSATGVGQWEFSLKGS